MNIQKNEHSWSFRKWLQERLWDSRLRVSWDKTTKGLHYQGVTLETPESKQGKEGAGWVWRARENGGRDTV